MKILSCLQPTYLSWFNFYSRYILCDVFVILDDVEYSKNSFFNRNKISNGTEEILLTVPVLYKNNSHKNINEIKIDNTKNWKRKHWQSILQCYEKTYYFKHIKSHLEQIYSKKWSNLVDLNISLIKIFAEYLEINKKIYISSELNINDKSNQKLVNICKKFNADHFVVKKDTDSYHPEKFFLDNQIKLKKINYDEINDEIKESGFNPKLSILDFISNFDPKIIKRIIK